MRDSVDQKRDTIYIGLDEEDTDPFLVAIGIAMIVAIVILL